MTTTILLLISALLPAIILCVYVYIKDRVEKEPVGLLLKLLLAGVIICVPVSFVETYLFAIIDNSSLVTNITSYNFAKYFIGVALVEEGFKFIAMYLVTKNSKQFNCVFDGIVYAVFVSLGFAALENILYVMQNGFYVAALRAVLSIPGHAFFGVIMGYYYSFWNIDRKVFKVKKTMFSDGLLSEKPKKSAAKLTLAFWMPVLAHGIYDFCCVSNSALLMIVFFLFIVFMYTYSFKKIKHVSLADGYTSDYVKGTLLAEYPEHTEYIENSL